MREWSKQRRDLCNHIQRVTCKPFFVVTILLLRTYHMFMFIISAFLLQIMRTSKSSNSPNAMKTRSKHRNEDTRPLVSRRCKCAFPAVIPLWHYPSDGFIVLALLQSLRLRLEVDSRPLRLVMGHARADDSVGVPVGAPPTAVAGRGMSSMDSMAATDASAAIFGGCPSGTGEVRSMAAPSSLKSALNLSTFSSVSSRLGPCWSRYASYMWPPVTLG